MTRTIRALRPLLVAAALGFAACGETPETTEQARGVLSGFNVVLALSVVFLVLAGAIVVGAVALDRALKARRALEEAPPEEEEEEEEVVAGIGVGRAPVPRWLYGFYVVIPVFALLYVTNAVALRPPEAAKPEETATPAPTGPSAEWTIVAHQIQFDLDEMIFPPNTEVTITFDNQDAGTPHNVAIYQSEPPAPEIFKGAIFPGADERDYTFTSPGVGEYYFQCDVHPNMNGTARVEQATA